MSIYDFAIHIGIFGNSIGGIFQIINMIIEFAVTVLTLQTE